MPGALSVDAPWPLERSTTVLGVPAFELHARVERERGVPLLLQGVVLLRGSDLVQVLLLVARSDQPRGTEVWERIRKSFRSKGAA